MADDRERAGSTVAVAPNECMACGAPQARSWSTPDGVARLCPPCATLHDLGCP